MRKLQRKTRLISSRTALAATAALALAGCTVPPGQAAQDSSSAGAGKSQHVVIVHEADFVHCPAFSPEHAIDVFDSASWQAHLNVAVLHPNKLASWQPDLGISTLLRYAQGTRPSAGYSVRLDGQITSERGVLTIPVRQSSPRKGMVAAAVVTSPCVYVQVTGTGYKRIRVIDTADGTVLKQLAL